MSTDPTPAPASAAATGEKPITPASVDPFHNAAEEADRNMHMFRRGLAIRAARREGTKPAAVVADAESVTSDEYGPIKMMRAWPAERDDDSPPDATALPRALAMHDALPAAHRPPDNTPLRNCLPGIWPTVGDLRALLATQRGKRYGRR